MTPRLLKLFSFNRTFMELKFATSSILLIPSLFQSYLYGIEISEETGGADTAGCFNRTFMELKYINAQTNRQNAKFQSYLYGIEISVLRKCNLRVDVSIVPLWN